MSKFSDYINNGHNQKNDNVSNNEKTSDKPNYTQEDLEAMINKYSTFSQDKLMAEFLKLTVEKKRRGELDDAEVERLKQTITPMLNGEQSLKLDQLLEMVKYVK